MSLTQLFNEVKNISDHLELTRLALDLSSYHRIQGSREILRSADFIRASLEDRGVGVSVHTFSYASPQKWISPLVGWDLRDGEVRVTYPYQKTVSSVRRAWTAVAAHSPGGEFAGRVSYVENEESIPSDAEVVLTSNRSLSMYLRLVEKGVKAVLIYRRDAVLDGVPYVSLFPTPSELPKMKSPVLCISRRDAEMMRWSILKGERVQVEGFVKASYTDPRDIKVISAEFGDGEKEVHLTAHYCHPKGTINDNVSGAAALLCIARALGRSIKRTGCELEGMRVRFVWIPEHYGSLALVRKLLKEGVKIEGALNLDMVGEKQSLTGSVLNFIRSPALLASGFEAHAFRNFYVEVNRGWGLPALNEIKPSLRFDSRCYVAGSDHDSYIVFGIPAVSLTNWPDRFYHTSLDMIDKFSASNALLIALTALKTVLTYEPRNKSAMKHYINYVSELEYFRARGSLAMLRQRIYTSVRKRVKCMEVAENSGFPSTQHILRVSKEPRLREELRKLFSREPWTPTALAVGALYSSCGISDNDLRKFMPAELGISIKESDFNLILEALQSLRTGS
ncbi:MAG: DUF4910 domain-containing protein [Zestosphaera sp.]